MRPTIQAPGDPRECRLLDFAPADPERAQTLSAAQVRQYNTEGFIHPFTVFSPDEAAANRQYFDSVMARITAMDDGRDSYSINGYHRRCRGIYDIATHPAILDIVEDLIGPDIVCWGTHFFCKIPHDPKAVPWHQDASYWNLSPSRTVTAWLAIDDADLGNACMQVIPQTHDKGHLEWRITDQPAVLNQELVGIEAMPEPVPIVMHAGQVSFHADMLAHGSTANSSSRRRCGLTMRYCPPSVEKTHPNDKYVNGILCRGVDPFQRWDNVSRPADDDCRHPRDWPDQD